MLILQTKKSKAFGKKIKLKKIIGLLNDELGGKIIRKIVPLRSERYGYLIGGI